MYGIGGGIPHRLSDREVLSSDAGIREMLTKKITAAETILLSLPGDEAGKIAALKALLDIVSQNSPDSFISPKNLEKLGYLKNVKGEVGILAAQISRKSAEITPDTLARFLLTERNLERLQEIVPILHKKIVEDLDGRKAILSSESIEALVALKKELAPKLHRPPENYKERAAEAIGKTLTGILEAYDSNIARNEKATSTDLLNAFGAVGYNNPSILRGAIKRIEKGDVPALSDSVRVRLKEAPDTGEIGKLRQILLNRLWFGSSLDGKKIEPPGQEASAREIRSPRKGNRLRPF